MRKALFIVTTGVLTLGTTIALAVAPVTRSGVNYSGTRNPGNCAIAPDNDHPTWLDVKCTAKAGATGPAFIRWRFLKGVGAVRGTATVSADISTWVGDECLVEWMSAPEKAARTVRVTIPSGSYCDIRSVTWSQHAGA
jgi:hypothetical protein